MKVGNLVHRLGELHTLIDHGDNVQAGRLLAEIEREVKAADENLSSTDEALFMEIEDLQTQLDFIVKLRAEVKAQAEIKRLEAEGRPDEPETPT